MENEIRIPINVRVVGFGCSSCPELDIDIDRLAWNTSGCINDCFCSNLDRCKRIMQQLDNVNKKGDTGNG